MIYDVAIIGLGPAGSNLARLLDKNLKVIALDKKGTGFCKPCGGLLAPDAQKSLARFGLNLPADILVDPQIFSVRTIDVKSGAHRHYLRHYINLDRHKFDLWLQSLIPSEVEVHSSARCTRITARNEGYAVTFKENDAEQTIQARYLVGADGANSIVRRTLFPKKRVRAYTAVQQWFQDSHATPFYSCVFDSDTTDCYAWGLSKNGSFIFGGAFRKQNARADFESLKLKLKAFGFQLDEPIKTEVCLVHRPQGIAGIFGGDNNAFLIGEAAGFVSPSSLEGISYALDSGYLLSRCFCKHPNHVAKAYKKSVFKLKRKIFVKSVKSFFMYRPLLRTLILKSGFRSIAVITKEK